MGLASRERCPKNRLITEAPAWFALQVRPRHELSVAAGLAEKGIDSLVPLYSERRRWSDRLKTVREPLFAGYVFCRIDRTARAQALRTSGVVKVVGFGGCEHPVSTTEIECLQVLMRSGIAAQPCCYLTVGDRVRITDGPFAGLSGLLTERRSERWLVVSLNLLQRSIAVEIGSASVEPTGPAWLGVCSA